MTGLSNGSNGDLVGTLSTPVSPGLAALANYGGSVATRLPLPGSRAICGGASANVPTGVSTDARGFARTNSTYAGYSSSSLCVDMGAVQTDYQSIQFTATSLTGAPGIDVNPAPVVSVTENGQNIGGVPVTLSFSGTGTATGLGPATTVSGRGASFSRLAVSADGTDTLSATLNIVGTDSIATSADLTLTIAGVTATQIAPLSSATYGTAQTLTATVTDGGLTVTQGSVTFTDSAGTVLPSDVSLSSGSASAVETLPAGTHIITATYNPATGYQTSSAATSSFTIAKAAITVTAASAAMTYGGALPAVAPTLTSGSLVSPDTLASIGITCAASTATLKTTCTGAPANYTVTYVAGMLTVNKAILSISAAPVSMTYGSALPTLTPAYSGFVNGDSAAVLSGAPALSTTATSKSDAGSYPITVAAGTLAAANYSFQFANGTLTITPAAQTISFDSIPAQTYGAGPLTLAASASSGLPVTFRVVSGPATLSGDQLSFTGGGTVVVEATQAGNGNYQAATPVSQSFQVRAGVLQLSPASLTFGGQLTGTPSPEQTVTLSNSGTAALTIAAIAASAGFSETSGCGASLAAGAQCSVQVKFAPAGLGASSGTLSVTSSASPAPQTVSLSGTGENLVLTSTGSGTTSVVAGQPALFALGITPGGGLTGTVALSCAVQPATLVQCAIDPTSLTLSGTGEQTVSVAIYTTATGTAGLAAPMLPPWPGSGPPREWLLAALALLAALGLAARRRRTAATAALGAALLLFAACGGVPAAVSTSRSSGTPAGSYTATITARAAGGSRTAQFRFVVQ